MLDYVSIPFSSNIFLYFRYSERTVVDQPHLSRRDALRAVGASGALGVVGSTGASAASIPDPVDAPGRDYGWSESEDCETDSSCVSDIHSIHSLMYLNATWKRFLQPDTDVDSPVDGCWRHTFALTGIGASGSDKFYPGLPYGTVSVQTPPNPTGHEHLSGAVATDAVSTAAAVSARRSPATFDFLEREAFQSFLETHVDEPRDLIRSNLDVDLNEAVYSAEATLREEPESNASTALSAMSALLGSVPTSSASQAADDIPQLWQKFGKKASSAGILLGAADVASKYIEALNVETVPRVDRGFAAGYPDDMYGRNDREVPDDGPGIPNYNSCNPHGTFFYAAGGHYLLFDVLEVPTEDAVSVVDVVSAFDRAPGRQIEGASTGWSIVLDTPVPEDGDPTTVPVEDRFSARAVAGDVTRHPTDSEVTN